MLFALAPMGGSFVVHVLPGMVLLGIGAGVAFNPVLLAAMSDVAPEESGLASGMVNTSFMMGGAIGLAILASLAEATTARALAAGTPQQVALASGYQAAFWAGAVCAALAGVIGWMYIRQPQRKKGA
jgi:MFS family permease